MARVKRLPTSIWALGFVSLLMDVSSELIHSLLPVFLTTVLGVSMLGVGVIEGLAEAMALFTKVLSGPASDWWGKRKPLALAGYGLGAISKPLFALATTADWVLGARLLDRFGKGLRGAPRDALIADLAPKGMHGAAFGLRQALDTTGAYLGPLLAMGLMLLWNDDFRRVFWVAVVPAFLCVALLAFGVREPADKPREGPRPNPFRREALRQLGGEFAWVAVIGGVFTLARFSEAFLVLRAQQGGLSLALTPVVLIAMNIVFSVGAYPFGKLSDRLPPQRLLAFGMVTLAVADAILATWGSGVMLWVGILLWGLHMALTQGLLAAMVARSAPPELRGTAFGVFNLASGVALLAASAVAGWLWDRWGAGVTFWAGTGFALAALALLLSRHAAPKPTAG